MTQAVGFRGEARTKAVEVMKLNRMHAGTGKELAEQQAELKSKVNKLFDMRASDPLIINRLRRVTKSYLIAPVERFGAQQSQSQRGLLQRTKGPTHDP